MIDAFTIAAGSFLAGVVVTLGAFCIAAAAIWRRVQ